MDLSDEAPASHDGSDKLCEACAKVPLTKEDLDAAVNDGNTRYSIGTIAEISLRRQCPLCRLLIATDLNDPQYKRTQWRRTASTIAVLVWNRNRKGFDCTQMSGLGTRMCFVRDENESIFGQGKRIETRQIDPGLVNDWLRRCQKEHGSECEAQGRTVEDMTFTGLNIPSRLIDVRKRCVVEVENPSVYVTLSYVWGKVRTLRLLQENRDSLAKPFALNQLSEVIPCTILDAMEFVASLGLSYLWVDALCIVQDDGEELGREIQHMDLIYENSLFTIIAAHGADANAGLPGVRPNSRQVHQIIEQVGSSTSLVTLYEVDDLLRTPVYSTRGWTYV
jgi:hypothetical protein